jgi:hypothetical protein
MRNTNDLLLTKRIFISALIALFIFGVQVNAQAEKDPHRPPCTSARCRKIKSFLKAHYCGESPFGNGPDDGCEMQRPKKLAVGINVKADFECKWSDAEGKSRCQQHGEPPSEVRSILDREMRGLGLPTKNDRELYFTVWESTHSGWLLAQAEYDHIAGSDLMLCQVILIIDQSSQVRVLRKVPYQKTNANVLEVTTWDLLDVADVDGDGHIEVILEDDAYENHWFEVDRVQDGSSHTIFSGLGYYL